MNQYYHSEDIEMNRLADGLILSLNEADVILGAIYDDNGIPTALVVAHDDGIDLVPLGTLPMITM